MSAIDIVDQIRELVAPDCFLIALEHAPFRLAAEDADVVSRLNSPWKDRQEEK